MLTRWQKSITQKQLADKLNIPPKFIDRTEIGRYTHLSLIKKLLIFYNKEIRIELIDRKKSNNL
jgi:DNA-binding helix-turn-helix protein